jgi:alkaline phosphatase
LDDSWAFWYVYNLFDYLIFVGRTVFSQPLFPAVDVNIYGSAGTEVLRGNHENTDIGEFIKEYLELDLASVTKKLKKQGAQFDSVTAEGEVVSWMGRLPEQDGRELDKLDKYHDDLRRHKH